MSWMVSGLMDKVGWERYSLPYLRFAFRREVDSGGLVMRNELAEKWGEEDKEIIFLILCSSACAFGWLQILNCDIALTGSQS